MEGSRARDYGLWLFETALAAVIAGGICWLWPRTGLQRLGEEQWWFSAGWLVALAGPSLLRPLGAYPRGRSDMDTFSPELCARGSFILGACFVAVIAWGSHIFNYKLWAGGIYLTGVTLRLAGVSIGLRTLLINKPQRPWLIGLGGGVLAWLACVLAVPWVRPDLTTAWPPQVDMALLAVLANSLAWGVVCGSSLIIVQAVYRNRRNAWIVFLAMALGVMPSLAVTWFTPLGCCIAALAAFVLALLANWRIKAGRDRRGPVVQEQAAVYWLLRALMLLWWGAGLAISLEVAWWQPNVEQLFSEAGWLRLLGFGAFLVTCLSLLAEYSLPLIGGENVARLPRRHRPLDIGLTIIAVAASLIPLGLKYVQAPPAAAYSPPSRVAILEKPLTLGPDNPEVVLTAPAWVTGLSRIHAISHLNEAADLTQGEPVAQLIATDAQGVPYVFLLRAGVDTAEEEFDRRAVNSRIAHSKARVAGSRTVCAPTGEAYEAHDYYTGLFLGRRVGSLVDVTLRYVYKNQAGKEPVLMTIQKIGLE